MNIIQVELANAEAANRKESTDSDDDYGNPPNEDNNSDSEHETADTTDQEHSGKHAKLTKVYIVFCCLCTMISCLKRPRAVVPNNPPRSLLNANMQVYVHFSIALLLIDLATSTGCQRTSKAKPARHNDREADAGYTEDRLCK
jgi:hypothetical protein